VGAEVVTILDDLPGGLELHHARREEEAVSRALIPILKRGDGRELVGDNEVFVCLIEVYTVVKGVPVLIDENLALAGLFDVTQVRVRPGRVRLENGIDGRIVEKRRPAGRVRLGRDQEVLPATPIKRAVAPRMRKRLVLRHVGRKPRAVGSARDPLDAGPADDFLEGRRLCECWIIAAGKRRTKRSADEQ